MPHYQYQQVTAPTQILGRPSRAGGGVCAPDCWPNTSGTCTCDYGVATRSMSVSKKSIFGLGEATSPALAGSPLSGVYGILSLVSSGASAYHGYKRNKSVGWAVAWGLLGGIFPIIVPAVAVAQGFGQKKA